MSIKMVEGNCHMADGGVKRDKIKDKNGKSHGKSRNHDTA